MRSTTRRRVKNSFSKKLSFAASRCLSRIHSFAKAFYTCKTRKVDFIVAGVQKGGTTALDYYLRQHPKICMASRKEIHFFDNKLIQSFPKTIRETYYHSFFLHCEKSSLWGEVTPIYTWWPKCVERMYEYNPELKIIIILRDPVSRAYSHWNMERQRGLEKRSFSVCIRRDRSKQRLSRIDSYVSRGFYSDQIRNLKSYYPESQLLFIKQEDLLYTPSAALKLITDFLHINSLEWFGEKSVHARKYASPIAYSDEKYLREIYLKDIEKVELELHWDLEHWKKTARSSDKSKGVSCE